MEKLKAIYLISELLGKNGTINYKPMMVVKGLKNQVERENTCIIQVPKLWPCEQGRDAASVNERVTCSRYCYISSIRLAGIKAFDSAKNWGKQIPRYCENTKRKGFEGSSTPG